MATVPSASPRPSLSGLRSPASSRTSLDTATSNAPSIARGGDAASTTAARRNRAALRDYYRLKSAAGNDIEHATGAQSRNESISAAGPPSRLDTLDKEGFDAGSYVRQLLEIENLEGLLGVENELVGEVRALDGERKALVYDNYSKLIAATETIIKMRANMDPLAPATITLAPAVSHIAETAVTFAAELETKESRDKSEAQSRRKQQVQLIKRALDGPAKLQTLLDNNQEAEAQKEWTIIKDILHHCSGAKDAKDILGTCASIMAHSEPTFDDG